MNEKDIRVIKTRESIEKAFFELLRAEPVSKITVTELAKIARINKGTSYLHYQDIPDLYKKTLLKTMLGPIENAGFHAVENAEIKYGDNVVVFGIGPVGLMAVAGSALMGCGRLFAIGTRPNCVALAKEYGATDIVSYKEGDIVEQILDLNHGQVDKVILAGGGGESFAQALQLTCPNGIISNVNFLDPMDNISFPTMLWGLACPTSASAAASAPAAPAASNAWSA